MSPVASFAIPSRFCGPPKYGNGGFTSGLLAAALCDHRSAVDDIGVEATIRKPIPLDKALYVVTQGSGVVLMDGEELVMEAARTAISSDLPHTVSVAEATEAAEGSPAFTNHPFPTCFVCGPERLNGDGLRIFPGRLREAEIFAAPWLPADEFADENGNVKPEIVWAALDCPTGFAGGFPDEGTLVTGRLGVSMSAPVKAGQPHVLVSWRTGGEGRKVFASAALLDARGGLCAQARATWIRLR